MYKQNYTLQVYHLPGIYSRYARLVQHLKINQWHPSQQAKKKNHMIISVDAEKAFNKIQYPFMIKPPRNRGECPQVGKENLLFKSFKWTAIIFIFNVKKLDAFPLRSETSQNVSSYHSYLTSYWKS